MNKTCPRCKENKKSTEFYQNKKASDGLHSCCKTCQKEYSRIYQKNNRDKVKAYAKKWYTNNKERQIAAAKKWNESNKEKVKENFKKWYESKKSITHNKKQSGTKIESKEIVFIPLEDGVLIPDPTAKGGWKFIPVNVCNR